MPWLLKFERTLSCCSILDLSYDDNMDLYMLVALCNVYNHEMLYNAYVYFSELFQYNSIMVVTLIEHINEIN